MKKKTGWIVLIAVIAVVALVVVWGVGSYNSLAESLHVRYEIQKTDKHSQTYG